MARTPKAHLSIRRGAELLYIYDKEIAEKYLWDSYNCEWRTSKIRNDLLDFEGELMEVAKTAGFGCSSAGTALAALKPFIRSDLCNDIRSIIRARGHSAHPVPSGKCQRLLNDLQNALSEAEKGDPHNIKTEFFDITVDNFSVCSAGMPHGTSNDSDECKVMRKPVVCGEQVDSGTELHNFSMADVSTQWEPLGDPMCTDALTMTDRSVYSDFSCQADPVNIRCAVFNAMHDEEHRADYNRKREAHAKRHPGGILPYDLRDFRCYVREVKKYQESKSPPQTCLKCGKFCEGFCLSKRA